ncbi:MAG: LCP family protein [Roseburia sp.]|nr:LCP family protein [Ruminococcus sp.]MCM1155774.1 LCP family protein [Roseburia sp.]MCM1242915.1 LCP family protein [Roseburia sp.]
MSGSFGIVRAVGKSRLRHNMENTQPILQSTADTEPADEEEARTWQEGWVRYNDTIYEYNDDIMTFLVMGIDKDSDAVKVAEGTDGGQADALFLVVMDPQDKSIKVIGINRNTMTDIELYDEEGNYLTNASAQIAVQHGFGDGMEESCEYQRRAVANLFYNLPIHGYAAINMSAIATINDAVGGIKVTVLEDMTAIDEVFVKDEQVHLMGDEAFWYVKYRDTDIFGSADMRLARQEQYLNGFIGAARRAAKKDMSVVLDLYRAISPQMVTDISLDEALYLASEISDYRFDADCFYTLEGETVMGEAFEEFYPDEDALYELIINVFYKEID